MFRSILAVLAASVIAFIWGGISWGMLPWHQPQPFKDPAAVVKVIKENTTDHAIYSYPDWAEMTSDPEAHTKKWSAGPTIYATIRPESKPEEALNATMLNGFLINILASTALLLLIQKSGHSNFLDRVSVALLAGLFLGLVSALNPWNWLEAPGLHTIGVLVDGIVPWTLAGIAIALILPNRERGFATRSSTPNGSAGL